MKFYEWNKQIQEIFHQDPTQDAEIFTVIASVLAIFKFVRN
ncbi:hypothetical protein [Bacillus pseudomycoides]|nr:hypothetical protein [Bacillus pseudomycoides]